MTAGVRIDISLKNQFVKIEQAVERAEFRNLSHAAARIRKDAAASIDRGDGPSPPGTPPHTHRRVWLRRALRFAVDEHSAVIGPRASVVGDVGKVHEFGGLNRGQDYPERPFMGPALDRNRDRFALEWQSSIGE